MSSRPLQRSQRLIYRIDNEAQKVCSKTLSEVLAADRRPRSDFRTETIASEYRKLHKKFHQLILFTRELVENPLIQKTDFKVQFKIVSEILKATSVLREELNRFDTGEETFCAPDEIQSFLNAIQNQLVRIDEEFQYLRQLEEYLVRVAELWESAEQELAESSGLLDRITQRIIHDTQSQKILYLSSNYHFHKHLEWVEEESDLIRWHMLIQSIHTARLSAWISGKLNWHESDAQALVMASLMKDLGIVRQIRVLRKKKGSLRKLLKEHEPHHPQIGSAIITGIKPVPVRLSRLISEHHERADGSGFPRNLLDCELSKESRLLIILNQLSEYYGELEQAGSSRKKDIYQLWCEAIQKLVKDSEEGLFEKNFTNRIVEVLGFGWQESEGDDYSEKDLEKFSYADQKQEVKPPHYLKEKQKKPTAGYRKKRA